MSISAALGDLREAQLPQGTVRYRERGDGPPLVFVHGLLVNGDHWRKVAPALASDNRCLVPDLPLGAHLPPLRPNADLSPPGLAQLLANFMESLDLRDVTLVGNDTGGALCQVLVARHPERVARLVLTNCDAFENFLPPMFRPLQWGARLPGFVFALAQPMRLALARRLFFATVARRPPERAVLASYAEAVLEERGVRRDATRVLRGISKRHTLEAARSFSRFERPVLIAWADGDRVFPQRYAERLSMAFPDARLERVTESRAFVPEDQPERLVELIRRFLDETA